VKYASFGTWAIASSIILGSFMDTVLLLFLLSKKVGGFGLRAFLSPFSKISLSAIAMGISLYIPLKISGY